MILALNNKRTPVIYSYDHYLQSVLLSFKKWMNFHLIRLIQPNTSTKHSGVVVTVADCTIFSEVC